MARNTWGLKRKPATSGSILSAAIIITAVFAACTLCIVQLADKPRVNLYDLVCR